MVEHSQNEVVDNSILSATARCSTQVVLRYVHHCVAAESNLAAQAGTAAHSALAHHFSGGQVEDCLTIFEREYRPICEAAAFVDDRLHWKNCLDILRQYFYKCPVSAYPFAPLVDAIESGVRVPFVEGIDYFALLDMLAKNKETRQLEVIDHKTTGRITDWWATKFQLTSQLSGYAWAAEQLYNMPVQTVYVNAIEFGKLPASKNKCKLHQVPFTECRLEHANFALKKANRSPEVVRSWLAGAKVLAGRFIKLKKAFQDPAMVRYCPQEGFFTDACTFCDYKLFCQAGRVGDLEQLFVKERWAPWERG